MAWGRNQPVPKFCLTSPWGGPCEGLGRATADHYPLPQSPPKIHKACPRWCKAQLIPVGHLWELGKHTLLSRWSQPPKTLERCRGVTRTEPEKTLDWEARGRGSSPSTATDSRGFLAYSLGLSFLSGQGAQNALSVPL